jgi:hypothetical protein
MAQVRIAPWDTCCYLAGPSRCTVQERICNSLQYFQPSKGLGWLTHTLQYALDTKAL